MKNFANDREQNFSEDYLKREERAKVVARELAKLFPGKQKSPLHYKTDFELLVAVILSAQATDKKINEVTAKLFKKYPTIKDYADAKLSELEKDLHQTGFYRAKAKYVRGSAREIIEKFGGKVPSSLAELTSLPGVGRKTALVVLGNLFGKIDGIAVDTHVIRLANKFQLVNSKNPVIIERELCALFPKKDWWNISYRLKAYGREYSPAHRGKDDPISLVLKSEGLLN